VTRPTVRLHEMARCRAGDKGDDSILVLVPHDAADYDRLVAAVSREAVAAHFGGMDPACVTVLPLPHLGAAVLTLRGRLAGGVTRSTGVDPHGKTLSGHLLDLELTLPDVPGRTENDQG
jgi:hypothetical protein